MINRVVKVTLRGDVSDAVAGYKAVGAELEKLIAAHQELGDVSRQVQEQEASARSQLASTAGEVSAAATFSLGAVLLASANFDESMSKVNAATHESAQGMEDLRAAALKAGSETTFSATEAADAITELAKAGVSTEHVLSGALDGALALAAAGELDVAQAAEIAATTLNQFGLAGDQASHVADILAATAGEAQGEVADMGLSLSYIGPLAKTAGISLEETAGAIGLLAEKGITGEKAGTQLRGVLAALQSPSDQARKTIEELGIQLYDTNNQFVGFDGAAGELKRTLSGLSNAERAVQLGKIFNSEQILAATLLYEGGAEAVQKWTDKVNQDGYAADTAARKLDNLKGDFEGLTGALETLLITSGDGAQGPLRELVQQATDFVNVMNGVPAPIKNTAVALLAITAATGGAIWLGSIVQAKIAATRTALTALGATAGTTAGKLALLNQGARIAAGIGAVAVASGTLGGTLQGSNAAMGALIGTMVSPIWGTAVGGVIGGFLDIREAAGMSAAELENWSKTLLAGVGKTPEDQLAAIEAEIQRMYTSGEILKTVANAAFGSEEGDRYDWLLTKQSQLTAEMDAAAKESESAGAAQRVLADGTIEVGTAAEFTTAQSKEEVEAFKALQNQALQTAEAFFGLGDSVNDSKVSLGDWIKDLEKQAKALRDFTKNARDAGKKGLNEGLIQELERAGPAGALRMRQLADGTEAEIARANKAWRKGQNAMRAYRDFVVPNKTLVIGTGQVSDALTKVQQLQQAISRLGLGAVGGSRQPGQGNGDPMGGLLYSSGGPVFGPGTKTSDSIPAMLSNGEYVVSASAVDYYGLGFFDAANAKRLADGGSANGSKGGGGYGGVKGTLDRFEDALKKSTKALDKERDRRDELVAKRDELAGSLKSAFTRDLFGDRDDGFVWKSEADRKKALVGDPTDILRQDIANGRAFQAELAKLRSKGLNGSAFVNLAQTGDLEQVRAFSGLSKSELAKYEQLFNQREKVATSVGAYAGNAEYGREIRKTNAHLVELTKENKAIKNEIAQLKMKLPSAAAQAGAAVGKAINGAAPKRPRRHG